MPYEHLRREIERWEDELGGTLGVAARELVSGREICYRADELFPLASVFKVPLMVTVMRHVDAGEMALDERLALVERDKSPGSTLIHCHPGLQPTVRDLLYLTITLSDNTATDMLWHRVGKGSINRTMRSLGLATIDCWVPNRPYFLIEIVRNGEWEGLTAEAVVAKFQALSEAGRDAALARIEELNGELSGADFLRLSDERYGRDGERNYEDSFVIDQALDNRGTPRDITALLAMIADGRCATPASCALMVEILSRQEWRTRIPAGLPAGMRVANKTGSVSGTVNDAALIFPSSGRPFALTVLSKGLGYAAQARAETAIAALAGQIFATFQDGGDPP